MSRVEPPQRAVRVGIRGPAGAGKTSLIEQLIPRLCARGIELAIITHDRLEEENALRLRRSGLLDPARVLTLARSSGLGHFDPIPQALDPDGEIALILIESDGDPLIDRPLFPWVDHWLFVIDAARAGSLEVPTREPGSAQLELDASSARIDVGSAPLLLVNKIDLAPFLGLDLARILRGLELRRGPRPTLLANCATGVGVDSVVEHLLDRR